MSARIVVCDDSPVILKPIEFKLKGAGYEVFAADDGEQGWDFVSRYSPDLVITDLQMPRMDGLDLTRRIRESAEHGDLPIMLLTAKGFELDCDPRFQPRDFSAIIRKPFSPREVLAVVESTLAARIRALSDTVSLT
jgi:CheY-like chemotaxis protein